MKSIRLPFLERSPNLATQVRPDSGKFSTLAFASTLATAFVLLLLLEYRWPYYFLQDDGLQYYLPCYLHDWLSLHSGHLPLYNFHVFAGIPHLAAGQTGALYIPQYVAMFLSETVWGHPFATLDLMAFMHALIAVAGGYVLLRYMGATDTPAAFGALAALTGFFVWVGRMWPVALMLCAWFPWMVWASLRYLEKPGAARAGWLMFFRLGLLYGGQVQFFILAMIFEHLFALSHSLVVRREHWQVRCLGYIALDIPTGLLGLPLLLPMWAQAERSLDRSALLSYGEFSSLHIPPVFWLMGQLFVFVKIHLPKHVVIARSIPYVSYIGYLSSLVSLGAVALWKRRAGMRPWIIASGACFFIALLWCWNILGPLIYNVPVLNRFRWPFKLIYFAGFFQCLAAALVLTLFSRRWQRVAIAVFLLNWIVVFCFLPNHAWNVREHPVPLRSPWQESLKDGRYIVISRSPVFYPLKQYVERNYSVFWGLDNLLGYEPLLPRLNGTVLLGRPMTYFEKFEGSYNGVVDQSFLEHLRKWGVKYVLVDPERSYVSGLLAKAGYKVQTVKQGWTLWEDPSAESRIHWGDVSEKSGSDVGIHWVEHINSIDVYLDQWPGRQLVFAFAANHRLETCFSGHCSPVGDSADGLIRVNVPPGTHHVRLVYHNALFLPSVIIALVTLMVYGFLLFRSRRVNRKEATE